MTSCIEVSLFSCEGDKINRKFYNDHSRPDKFLPDRPIEIDNTFSLIRSQNCVTRSKINFRELDAYLSCIVGDYRVYVEISDLCRTFKITEIELSPRK